MLEKKFDQNESTMSNKDEKMLNIVSEENGHEMDKRDAIFMAFIADYSWDAIKQKNKNIKMPTTERKMTL